MYKPLTFKSYAQLGLVSLIICYSVFTFSSCKKNDSSDPAKAPTITSLDPAKGKPGTEITINGSNFSTDPTKNIVMFGDITATVSSATATALKTTLPGTLTVGTVKVKVTVGENTSSEVDFTVEAVDANQPQITKIDPAEATAGSTITLTGTNFGTANTITFTSTVNSSNTATVKVNGSSPLQVVVPSSLAAGTYNVTLNNGTLTSPAVEFSVLAPPLTITGFSPESISKNQVLTIKGTNFTGVDAVTINGKQQNITVVNDSTITLKILPKTFSGKIVVYKSGKSVTFNKNLKYKETYTTSKFSSYGLLANTIAVDTSGNIYLACGNSFFGGYYILKLSPTGAFIDTIAKQDTTGYGDILVRQNGEIWVTTLKHGNIMKVTGKNQLKCFYSFKEDFSLLRLVENKNQELFTISNRYNKAYKFNNGSPKAFYETPDEYSYFDDIATDSQNNTYLVCSDDGAITKINHEGNNIAEIAHYNKHELRNPAMGIHPIGGMIYLTTEHEHSLVKYEDGDGFSGVSLNDYNFSPTDLTFTLKGDMIVCGTHENYLIKIIID